jgi:dihydroxyacetone kinase-like predicted kinase
MHRFGEFLKLKIENMTLEHTDNDSPAARRVKTVPASGGDEAARSELSEGTSEFSGEAVFSVEKPEGPAKLYGTVVVSVGDGFNEIFTAMGTDAIVSGGQSFNPSASDFIDAFKKVNAENIIVFPNNKNINLAARQAADMYEKAKVHVIDTVNLGQGYIGLAAVAPDETDVDAIIDSVNEAISLCDSGSVSVAVKSGNFDGIAVNEGDFIGFVGKNIVSSEKDLVSASMLLADHLLADESKRGVLTCFTGKDTTDADNSFLEKAIGEKYPDVELFFAPGGQDIYSYIFVTG